MPAHLYHVVRVNDATGRRINLTSSPVTHAEALAILSKVSTWPQFPQLRTVLEEAR